MTQPKRSAIVLTFGALVLVASATASATPFTLPFPIFAAADDVTVDLTAWAAPTVTTFDPAHPPADLEPGESADAASHVEFDSPAFDTVWDPATSTATVTSVNAINVDGGTDIRLPSDADQMLKDHENGHDALSKNEYENRVKQKIQDAFRGFKGMKFVGAGATDAARKADAQAKAVAEGDRRAEAAKAAIDKQNDTLNEKYDKLTDHGRGTSNDPKSGKFLDTSTGIAEALAERDKAPKAGQQGVVPDSAKPLGSTAPDPPFVFFDPDLTTLLFGGDLELAFARDPADTILGRGRVQVDPIVVIGLQENGTIHLSDTTAQIVDRTTAGVLMNAFLFELAYMPSSLPGFAGMIQGYLDIPPPFAGGINNTISSDFLAAMQAASLAGEPTTFWFFVDRPLFDAQGMVLNGGEAVTGSLKFGVAASIPEPGTLTLFSIAAFVVGGYSWRNRRNDKRRSDY